MAGNQSEADKREIVSGANQFFACVRLSVSLSVTLNMNSYWDPNVPSKIDTLIGLCLIMFTILLLIFDQRKGEQI